MLPEPLVLNGHGGVDEVLGYLIHAHPYGAGHVEEGGHLLILPGGLVLVVHNAVLPHGEVVGAQVGNWDNHLVYVDRGEAAQQRPGTQPDEDQGAQKLEEKAHHSANAAPLPLVLFLPALPAGRLAAGGIFAVFI